MAQIPYRQLQGMASEMAPGIPMPHYATIFRRIRDLRVQKIGGMVTVSAGDGSMVLFAVDTTGIKVANRGKWIRQKWKVRRGFIKMHTLVDTDTGMILALRVTDESVGDSKMFVPLLEDAQQQQQEDHTQYCTSVLADGAYASRDIHKACADRGGSGR